MKLFVIHVGYYDYEVGMYELHSQFLVVAKNASEAKASTMAKPIFTTKKMHIDGIQEINSVDGYVINLTVDNKIIKDNKIYNYNEIKAL